MISKQQLVIKETKRIWYRVCKLFDIKPPLPEIKFSNRYTATVAVAHINEFNLTITYSNKYINSDDKFIKKTTIKHEVAHLFSYILYGIEAFNHGKQWKDIMHRLGVDNPLAINDDINPLPTKTCCYEYVCEQCNKNYFVSRKKHLLFSSNIIVLVCKFCHNNKIKYIGKVDN